jgi:membrane dipeptidase
VRRRSFLAGSLATGIAMGGPAWARAAEVSRLERVDRLMKSVPFVNGSDITPFSSLSGLAAPVDMAQYVAAMKAGGISVVSASFICWLYDGFGDALHRLRSFRELVARHSTDLLLIDRASDIERARSSGRVGLLMHAHTPSIIDADARNLPKLREEGLRVMGFSHQQRSLLAEGAGEALAFGDGGLSAMGRFMIGEMNRLRMVIDLGHVSERSIVEAAKLSEQPVLVSHTACRALTAHKVPALLNRNISDDAMRAVAANGGVIGIMSLTPHLLAAGSSRAASIELMVDHIDHAIAVAGVDHVAIGTESAFGGATDMRVATAETVGRLGPNTPVTDTYKAVAALPPGTGLVVDGMRDLASIKRNMISALVARGRSDDDVAKILGGNLLRLYDQVLGPA